MRPHVFLVWNHFNIYTYIYRHTHVQLPSQPYWIIIIVEMSGMKWFKANLELFDLIIIWTIFLKG